MALEMYTTGRKYGGVKFLIDDEDFEKVSERSWNYCPINKYVYSQVNYKLVRLHRYLMEPPKGFDVDHINLNRLDNRRCNLRICTHSQNMANRSRQSNNTTNFKGVSFRKDVGKYEARIKRDRRLYHLGLSEDPVVCAKLYDQAARELFGEFAVTNF